MVFHMLWQHQKWKKHRLSCEASTTNGATCGRGRKPSRTWESSARRSQRSSSNGWRDRPFGRNAHQLWGALIDLISKWWFPMRCISLTCCACLLICYMGMSILSGTNVTSRYKVTRPMRMQQAKDTDTWLPTFTRLVLSPIPRYSSAIMAVSSKQGWPSCWRSMDRVMIWHVMMKYQHTHMAFIEALNKVIAEWLFKLQDMQELNNPKKMLLTWVKHRLGW